MIPTVGMVEYECTAAYFTQDRIPGMMVLKMWSLHQQHHCHLGTCDKCKFLGSTPDLLHWNLQVGVGGSNLFQ